MRMGSIRIIRKGSMAGKAPGGRGTGLTEAAHTLLPTSCRITSTELDAAPSSHRQSKSQRRPDGLALPSCYPDERPAAPPRPVREMHMDGPSFPSQTPHIGLLRRLSRALRHWLRAWRASIAAEDTYETTRRQAVPRQVATHAAFKALTGDDRPALPDVAASAQALQSEARGAPEQTAVPGCSPPCTA